MGAGGFGLTQQADQTHATHGIESLTKGWVDRELDSFSALRT